MHFLIDVDKYRCIFFPKPCQIPNFDQVIHGQDWVMVYYVLLERDFLKIVYGEDSRGRWTHKQKLQDACDMLHRSPAYAMEFVENSATNLGNKRGFRKKKKKLYYWTYAVNKKKVFVGSFKKLYLYSLNLVKWNLTQRNWKFRLSWKKRVKIRPSTLILHSKKGIEISLLWTESHFKRVNLTLKRMKIYYSWTRVAVFSFFFQDRLNCQFFRVKFHCTEI